MSRSYDPAKIEPHWQSRWEEAELFSAKDLDLDRPKYYVLDMFPFPSGAGLHVGHPEGYTATDILCRYKRMRGFNVLHPMGWDAFGLPAEQHAIKTQTHPRITTDKNINNFRRQIKRLGFSYDWSREVDTSDPAYYKWTQWIFLKLLDMGLAYQAEIAVNWCPGLGTVLANEEVTADGKSERGGFDVVRRPMKQWVLKITAYADRLISGLDGLDWPEGIKEMQRQWIGRSEGAQVRFDVANSDASFEVFTTRPDTLFGCTYCVLSPEHPLVAKITTDGQKSDVDAYIEAAARKSELNRTSLDKDKTGVFTGAYALNPVNGQQVPIWIADYVLISYGSGAIMAVPGQDQRDWDFAKAFDLPIIRTVQPTEGWEGEAFKGDGVAINSGFLDGLAVKEAKAKITTWLVDKGLGEAKVSYRLRDWVFSRQRYWGEPFPIIHVEGEARPIPESELPLILPEVEKFQPTGTGESPLASQEDWITTTDPRTGEAARRETDTMPNWAGSCWYYLRYIDPKNPDKLVDPAKENYWMPVDLYIGGSEHAVLHLLYARFWHKVLFDLGVVSTEEPFQRLVNQGMILGSNGEKMSKSLGNVVNPDDIVEEFGADSLRLYEMFMGPLEAVKPWNTQGVHGILRFLKRVHRLVTDILDGEKTFLKTDPHQTLRHQTIKKVTNDTEGLRFNTAIAQLMTYTNALYKTGIHQADLQALILLLSPYAPHLGDECWSLLKEIYGGKEFTQHEVWPTFDEALTKEATVTIGLSINGKNRGSLEIAVDAKKDDVLAAAKAHDNVQRHLEGKRIVKEIYVPGRMVNLVVK